MNKLWILERTEEGDYVPTYDCNDGFVIVAATPRRARALAASTRGDEGAEVWLDADRSSCIELSPDQEEGIVLADFHAG